MIKAIETHYRGYRFRSRLEARWAVFFDALRLRWEYEPEGFDIDGVRYLPDFFLPEFGERGLFIEVKREGRPKDEQRQTFLTLFALTQGTGVPSIVCSGEPFNSVLISEGNSDLGNNGYEWWHIAKFTFDEGVPPEAGSDGPYIFCICPWCKKVGLEFDGRGARVCGWKAHFENYEDALSEVKALGHYRADDKCYTGGHPKIRDAALRARAARFEHGECPA